MSSPWQRHRGAVTLLRWRKATTQRTNRCPAASCVKGRSTAAASGAAGAGSGMTSMRRGANEARRMGAACSAGTSPPRANGGVPGAEHGGDADRADRGDRSQVSGAAPMDGRRLPPGLRRAAALPERDDVFVALRGIDCTSCGAQDNRRDPGADAAAAPSPPGAGAAAGGAHGRPRVGEHGVCGEPHRGEPTPERAEPAQVLTSSGAAPKRYPGNGSRGEHARAGGARGGTPLALAVDVREAGAGAAPEPRGSDGVGVCDAGGAAGGSLGAGLCPRGEAGSGVSGMTSWSFTAQDSVRLRVDRGEELSIGPSSEGSSSGTKEGARGGVAGGEIGGEESCERMVDTLLQRMDAWAMMEASAL